jgi:ABC-type antimicrobial peptide transport system permease subunit
MKAVGLVAAAIMLVVGIALMTSWGAGLVVPWMMAHPAPSWLTHALPGLSGLFCSAMAIFVARRRRREQPDETPLTPLVRRDPKTGLRLL